MHYYHKFAIIGLAVGLLPIIFGIIALTSPAWIRINYSQASHPITYDLFRQCITNKNSTNGTFKNEAIECSDKYPSQISQYLQISGYIVLVIGLFVGVLCTALVDKRSIHFLSPIILLLSTIMILLGWIFYIKYLIEMNHISSITELHLGYSIIFMIVTCIIGIFLTAYFSFTAGYIHRHIISTVNIY